MRTITILLLLIPLINGCKKEDSSTSVTSVSPVFHIDLQASFQNDSVRVSVDQNKLFAGTITTSLILSLATSISPSVTVGAHDIKVEIFNQSVQADTTINVSDTITLAINYNRTSKIISFKTYPFALMYR
jgi:hypothetical protein